MSASGRRAAARLHPRLALVRAGHRAQRRDRRHPARGHRPARPERGGQVDLPQARRRAAAAEPGRGAAARASPAWGSPEVFHRVGLCPETDAFWENLTGLAVPDDAPALHRLRRGRVPAPGRERPPPGGAPRREGPQDRRLQQGDAPAGQARAGDRPRPRGAAARRAGERDGPGEPPARDRPRAAAGPRGEDGRGLEPHPLRGRGHDEAGAARPQRAHPGRGRRARDPRPPRRAPAHRGPAGPRAAPAGRGPRGLAERALASPSAAEGEWVTVETARPDEFYGALHAAALEAGVVEMYSPDENLESVFKYLVAR